MQRCSKQARTTPQHIEVNQRLLSKLNIMKKVLLHGCFTHLFVVCVGVVLVFILSKGGLLLITLVQNKYAKLEYVSCLGGICLI